MSGIDFDLPMNAEYYIRRIGHTGIAASDIGKTEIFQDHCIVEAPPEGGGPRDKKPVCRTAGRGVPRENKGETNDI